jgi:proteasome lid subunit RPN8/RPN11
MSYFNYQSRMGLMPVSPGVLIAAQEHAKSISFEEVCGVVIGDTYHPMTNLATSPTEHFEIDPQEYLGIQAKMGGAKLQAIIHSHPDGDACPSEHDMVQQLAWGVPWGIIAMRDHAVRDVVFFGDGCPIAPMSAVRSSMVYSTATISRGIGTSRKWISPSSNTPAATIGGRVQIETTSYKITSPMPGLCRSGSATFAVAMRSWARSWDRGRPIIALSISATN